MSPLKYIITNPIIHGELFFCRWWGAEARALLDPLLPAWPTNIAPFSLRAYTKRLRLNAKYAVRICLVRCEIRVGVEVPKRPQR